MSQPSIEPRNVTKPLQLLAAWLVGLILIDTAFLTGASQIDHPLWASGALTVAAIVNVPIFLGFLFLMQTRFRPEMQEDTFYARYLERRSTETQKTELIRINEGVLENTTRVSRTRLTPSQSKGEIEIEINDLLPRFDDIVRSLNSAGMRIVSTFGSTSKSSDVPSVFVVSFRNGVDPSTVRKVMTVLDGFDVDGVALTDGPYEDDSVYVGSYIFREFSQEVTPYTTELKTRLLDPQLDSAELNKLVKTIEWG